MTTGAPTIARKLTIVVGGQACVLPGERVLEVIRRPMVTRVPHGPAALLGVSNLRGAVLPVVSLAALMNKPAGTQERVVVLDHNGPVGLLVDAVTTLEVGDEGTVELDFAAMLDTVFKRPAAQEQAAPKRAADAGTAPVHTQQRVLLSFLVNGQTFALPLAAVSEVVRLPGEIARVSHADEAVLGLTTIRDQSLPVIWLAGILGFSGERMARGGERALLVTHDGARIALVVDAVEAIVKLDEAAIDPVPAILQRGRGHAELDAIGRPGHGQPLISILSVPKLFANSSVEASVASAGGEKTALATEHAVTARQEQFVVFDLGGERYGLPVGAVQEILRLPDTITRLPNGPRFVTGLINLRGKPVPIIDQRQRFDAPPAGGEVRPRVVVLNVGGLQTGFVVDAVLEILSLGSDALAAAPPLASERAAVFSRVARAGSDGALILLIDPQELLSAAEQDVLADIAARQAGAGAR